MKIRPLQRFDKINESFDEKEEVHISLLSSSDREKDHSSLKDILEKEGDKLAKQKYNTFLRRLTNSSSRERRLWNLLIVTFVMYNAILIPLRLSFRDLWNDYNLTVVFLTFDYIGDTIFIIDMVLRFFTPYYNNGFLIRDNKRIALHYLKTWFLLDFISSLPIDFIHIWSWKHSLLRLPRLLRFAHFSEIFTSWRQYTIRFGAWIKLAQLVGLLMLVIHWVACLYIAMAYAQGWPDDSKFTPPPSLRNGTFAEQYSYSFNYAMRFVTRVGGTLPDPDTDLSRTIADIEALFILFLTASIIGSITGLMTQFDPDKKSLETKIERINNYIKKKKLGAELTNKIRAHIQREFSKKGTVTDENEILKMFPSSLKLEIMLHTHRELIEKVPFFTGQVPGLVEALIPQLKGCLYEQGDLIIQTGEVGTEIFFLIKGKVAVMEAEEVVAVLTEGQYFGELALVQETTRTATVKALTPVELFTLSRKDFEEVLSKYPQQKKVIIAQGKLRLSLNKFRALLQSRTHEDIVTKVFVELFRPVFINQGDIFIEPNTTIKSIYLICEGSVELVPARQEPVLVKELNLFGNIGKLAEGISGMKATAKTDVMTLKIDWLNLQHFYSTYSESADVIWNAFIEEFHISKHKSESVLRRSFSEISRFSNPPEQQKIATPKQQKVLTECVENMEQITNKMDDFKILDLEDLFGAYSKVQNFSSALVKLIEKKTKRKKKKFVLEKK